MRLLRALRREELDRPPIWMMRQAGRYLPEYRELRQRYSFEEAMLTPGVAAEITLQPLRRFPLDSAIVFADIMTPLVAMGVRIEFAPGPRLMPLTVDEVARLEDLDPAKLDHLAETIAMSRSSLDPEVAVIGFSGGPVTLLAYLLEGGGSKDFTALRLAIHSGAVEDALAVLARAMHRYLAFQISAGADVVQVFDSWAGLLPTDLYQTWAVPSARQTLQGLRAPTIYFAPGASHLLESFHLVGADAYGVDWRLPLATAWRRVGEQYPIQGNLDPSVLLGDPETARQATLGVLDEAAGRPGHIFNLGHGVLPQTRIETVAAVASTVVGHRDPPVAMALEQEAG